MHIYIYCIHAYIYIYIILFIYYTLLYIYNYKVIYLYIVVKTTQLQQKKQLIQSPHLGSPGLLGTARRLAPSLEGCRWTTWSHVRMPSGTPVFLWDPVGSYRFFWSMENECDSMWFIWQMPNQCRINVHKMDFDEFWKMSISGSWSMNIFYGE